MNEKYQKGAGVVEIIIGLAIMMVGVFSVVAAYNYYLRFAVAHENDVQAALLAEEGIEVVKLLRDSGWSAKIATLSPGVNYGIEFINGAWTSTTSLKYIDAKFLRTFVLNNVYRDASYDIASLGTLDLNTKEVTVSVSARNILATSTKTISTYITNIFSN